MRKLRIAFVGSWHVHGRDFAGKLQAMPDCEVTVYCGERSEWAEELSCRYETDYEKVLQDQEVDAVLLACSTAAHEEMIIRAANAGKHVFIEKALAVSNKAAYAIRDAVKENDICFTMSDPVMKAPQMFAKRLADEGKLGEIINMRVRCTHDQAFKGEVNAQFFETEQSGGGAMIDTGCKAVHILYQFMGRPVRANAMFHSYSGLAQEKQVDDNAVAVYQFPNGAIGVAECGWYSPKYQLSMDVLGTKGCICQRDDQVFYRLEDTDWIQVKQEELPPAMTYPLNEWVDSMRCGKRSEKYGIEEAVCLTEMITAAYASVGKAAIVL
ncbi:MAG: Gfo/Idh/MocA family oxidoreductase [Lachnospiraceae bacterium]|nr:Gfo/Idh/MocA family oxidoreductase [Lachnospiraceae bacterium]